MHGAAIHSDRPAVLVPYHRCEACGFLFTPFFDNWTQHAFQRFIYNDDYIVVDPEYIGARPIRVAERFADLLAPARGSRVLDWGAGSGIFAAEMADAGSWLKATIHSLLQICRLESSIS